MRTADDSKREDAIDRALIRKMRAGDARAEGELVARYTRRVHGIASHYTYPGGDRDDARQEGFVGLTLAMRQFDMGSVSPFGAFVELVVRRHVVTGLKAATRMKHNPLSHSIRWANVHGEAHPIVDLLPSGVSFTDPHSALCAKEDIAILKDGIETFSAKERVAFLSVVQGIRYSEIDAGDSKSVDNAVQRARHKLQRRGLAA